MSKHIEIKQFRPSKSTNNVQAKKNSKQINQREKLTYLKTNIKQSQSDVFVIVETFSLPIILSIKSKQKNSLDILKISITKKSCRVTCGQSEIQICNNAKLNKKWLKILLGSQFQFLNIDKSFIQKGFKYFTTQYQYNILHSKENYERLDLKEALNNFKVQNKIFFLPKNLEEKPYMRAVMPRRPLRNKTSKLGEKFNSNRFNETSKVAKTLINTKNLQQIVDKEQLKVNCFHQTERQSMTSTNLRNDLKSRISMKHRNIIGVSSKNSRFSHQKDTANTDQSNIMKCHQFEQLECNFNPPSTLTYHSKIQNMNEQNCGTLSTYQLSEHEFNLRKMKLNSQNICRKDMLKPIQAKKHSIIVQKQQNKIKQNNQQFSQNRMQSNQSEIQQEIMRQSKINNSQLMVSEYQDTLQQNNMKKQKNKQQFKTEQSQQLFESKHIQSGSDSLYQSKYQ